MVKIFKVSQVRDLLNQVHNEKISFSRMVEIMNEIANKEKTVKESDRVKYCNKCEIKP